MTDSSEGRVMGESRIRNLANNLKVGREAAELLPTIVQERDEARAWAILFRDFVGWTPQEHYETYRRYLEAVDEAAYPDWLKDAK